LFSADTGILKGMKEFYTDLINKYLKYW
jgi:hypothetical protein